MMFDSGISKEFFLNLDGFDVYCIQSSFTTKDSEHKNQYLFKSLQFGRIMFSHVCKHSKQDEQHTHKHFKQSGHNSRSILSVL